MDEQPPVNGAHESAQQAIGQSEVRGDSRLRRTTRALRGKAGLTGLVALLLLLSAAGYIASVRDKVPSLREMGLSLPEPAQASLLEGPAWQPGPTDRQGFAPALDNGKFRLDVDPLTSAVALRNGETGYVWRSNPPQEELERETVKGTLLANLKSPFILEYHEAGKTQRLIANGGAKELETEYRLAGDTLQVSYWLAKQSIGFSIQYRLTSHGLEVRIPDAGIREEGGNYIVSLQTLPFLGAARNEEPEGYLFVPDGPGGLIRFDADRTIAGRGYRYPLYGDDLTVRAEEAANVRETMVTYPVFGIKRREEAFVALLKEGRFESRIKAQPAGIVSGYNTAGAEWIYRAEYGQRLSRLSPPVNTIQRERIRGDRVIEYRLLAGEDAGYVQMAHAYRDYLLEAGELSGLSESSMSPEPGTSAASPPLLLTIVGGSSGPSPVGDRYAAATTFGQAERIVEELADSGVAAMEVTLRGWQKGGEAGKSSLFPVEGKLGGNAGAKSFVDKAHGLGYKVLFEQDFVWYGDGASGVAARTDGIRAMDGTAVLRKGSFAMTPEQSAGRAYSAIEELEKLGADGLVFENYGQTLYRDHHPERVRTREQTGYLFGAAMDYARQRLGSAVAETGSDYILSHASRIQELPFETSYDFSVDETVPFYPIVLHGLIPYSFTPGNMRDRYEDHLLKAIEYGALPSFVVTYAPSISIRYTLESNLYSTHFAKWKERIVEEYQAFSELAPLYGKPIVGHRELRAGVYATEYEGGTRVVVDYNASTFEVIGGN